MKHKYLEPALKLILDLKEDVRRKALLRLKFENLHSHKEISEPTGRFYRNPEGFALERYCYYQCFKCKKVRERERERERQRDATRTNAVCHAELQIREDI